MLFHLHIYLHKHRLQPTPSSKHVYIIDICVHMYIQYTNAGISHSFGMDKCKEVINIYASTTEGMSFEDFLIFYCQNSKNCSEEEELRRVFRLLDDNGDGYVEIGKLRHIIETLQPSLFKVCNLDDVYRQNASLRKSSFVEGYRKGLMSYQDFVRFLNE